MNKLTKLLILFILAFSSLSSQNKVEDSLVKLLKVEKNNHNRLTFLSKLVEVCDIGDNLKYSNKIIQEATNLQKKTTDTAQLKKLQIAIAKAYEYKSIYYQDNKFYNQKKAVEALEKASKIYLKLNLWDEYVRVVRTIQVIYSKKGDSYLELQTLKNALETTTKYNAKIYMAKYIHQLARFYADISDTINALNYANKGIELEKEINDPKRLAKGYLLGGEFYNKINHPKKAIILLNDALERFKLAKDTSSQIDCLIGIGESYKLLDDYTNSKKVLLDAKMLAKNLVEENNKDLAPIYELSLLEFDFNHFEEALKVQTELMKESKKRNYLGAIATGHQEFARIYFKLKDFKKAKTYAMQSLEFMRLYASLKQEVKLEEICYQSDSVLGNYGSAFSHFQKFVQLKNKLNVEEIKKESAKEQLKIKFQKEAEKQNENYIEEKKKQKTITNYISIGLFSMLIIALLVFYNLRKSQKTNKIIAKQKTEVEIQKHLIQEKQNEILESITYAKRLQQAILPPTDFINKYLNNNFILYVPKDIVAGDFYWAEIIGEHFFIASADSTGHGVPGAMVSVVCSNCLNRAIKEFKVTETGKILDKTRELVLETFEKSAEEVKDGMDISLLSINTKTKRVFWSGANNPLWYIQNNELKEIKGDKQPIGKTDYPKSFTTHQIEVKESTTFYLFTDGLADQFGGPKGKKFKYKQFEDLLISNCTKTMNEQFHQINQQFISWKGNLEQVDDICIIGIKI